MKNLLKTVLATGALAVTASVAQANLIDSTTDVLTSTDGGTPTSFTVTSDVLLTGTVYTYQYMISGTKGSAPETVDFTVGDIAALAEATITDVNTAGGFAGTAYSDGSASYVTWEHSGPASLAGLCFSYESTLPPTVGDAFANDGHSWDVNSSSVYVPNVPDGGMTASLLGLSFLGLGAIRRKLGC